MIHIIIIIILFIIIDIFISNNIVSKNINNDFFTNDTYGLNKIPMILYINLKHRLDRKENIEKQLNLFNYKNSIRIDAIKKDNGALGCALSHIKALEYAYSQNVSSVLILEDDFIWKYEYSKDFINQTIDKLMTNMYWDVCLLSCNGNKKNFMKKNYYFTNIKCQTTSSYIIKRNYIPVLVNFWKNTIKDNKIIIAIDQSWKELQKKDKWISSNPLLGKQLLSYSDIEKKIVNYGI